MAHPEESSFTPEETTFLLRLAALIIPPASADGLPGGDDNQVFTRLIGKAVPGADRLKQRLHELVATEGGLSNLLQQEDRFTAWFDHWAEGWPKLSHPFFVKFVQLLAQAYYEDPRVQIAHHRRPGPPFPEGYDVIQGDWSLLDPVRDRPPMYRR